jgi:hypothetical protein
MAVGQKHDQGKPMMGLIPPHAELVLAQVLTFGAQKYSPGNWRHVENARERYMDALLRHINAVRRGEVLDPESGLPHMGHAMCCISFLIELDACCDLYHNVTQEN